MSQGYHRTTIVGYVGKDPVVTYIKGGMALVKFSVGVSESFKKGDEWHSKTEWYNVVVWGKKAERIESGDIPIAKGKMVTVVGKMQTNSWDGKDGKKQYQTVLNAMDVLVSKNGAENAIKAAPEGLFDGNGDEPTSDSDIPF